MESRNNVHVKFVVFTCKYRCERHLAQYTKRSKFVKMFKISVTRKSSAFKCIFDIFYLTFFLLFVCSSILFADQLVVNDAILVPSLQEPVASGTGEASHVVHIVTCS